MGILHPHRCRRGRWPRHLEATRELNGVNPVWDKDVKYGYIKAERRFFFVQTILDMADRSVINYHIDVYRCPACSNPSGRPRTPGG